MIVFLRRFAASTSLRNPCTISQLCRYSSKSGRSMNLNEATYQSTTARKSDTSFRNHLGVFSSPVMCQDQPQFDSRHIKVLDSDAWSISSCLAKVSNGAQEASQLKLFDLEELGDGVAHAPKQTESNPDFDDVEDMRIRGKLFYKVERSSMEFDEYKFDFHGRKFKSENSGKRESKKNENLKCENMPNGQTPLKSKEGPQENNKKEHIKHGPLVNKERLAKTIKEKYLVRIPDDPSCVGKKRTPTFNQLTGPYHEPFCLDIFVSKGSVRACVIHRLTSKVVVVAHSISKDLKFDLGSTKSVATAAAVGKILAQRALEDDIHDVIYTPRKGDKLEGKLQVVLQSVMDNGIQVKVKLKQRNSSRALGRSKVDGWDQQ